MVSEHINGANFACLRRGDGLQGAGYAFLSQRAARTALPEVEGTPVNAVTLADGKEYNIAGMETKLVTDLIEFAFNGTAAAGIPSVYKEFEV